MNPLTIIRKMQGDGLSLSLTEEGQIDVAGDGVTIERWLPLLRKHKPEVFAALSDATFSDLSMIEEQAIRSWLWWIVERDPLTVEQVVYRCKVDGDARQYLLLRSKETPAGSDDRRFCDECSNLNDDGYCEAATRGELEGAGRWYKPVLQRQLPARCLCFKEG